jgi:predicted nucleic acid-binding protein
VTLVLDAGALIAYERGSKRVQAFLERAVAVGENVAIPTAVVAQVWRDGARQARVVLLLRGVEEIPLSPERARRSGELQRAAESADVVDASVVDLALDGDEILTSDLDDIHRLAQASGKTLIITPIS